MKYLYSWLKEFYPDIPLPETVADNLIQLGHEVDSIQPLTYEGIIAAEIVTIAKHPNADALSLVTITDGANTHDVVCGAPNLQVGQKVAYATIGTTLPCGLKIAPIKIRGEASNGMLCAEDELGIGPDHSSLLPLPDTIELGSSIQPNLPLDAIIDIELTPNRGDVFSHFGLARDLYALTHDQVLEPMLKTPTYTASTDTVVSIGDVHADANAYSLGYVMAESVVSTPLLMQSRLALLGMKSINLATDLTNYLLLAFGQPMHAYDLDTLERGVFGVRRAREGEKLAGLNGINYHLTPQSLVITVNDTVVGLAGTLGGEVSKITKNTKRVLFEVANFNSKAITIMTRGLGISTDSSVRFERGVDPLLRLKILQHAQVIWQEVTYGISYEPIEHINKAYEPKPAVEFTASQLSSFVGMSIEPSRVDTVLTGLGCHATKVNDMLHVIPPSWRNDLEFIEDYYEEIVRMIGLQNIPKVPLPATVPQWKRSMYWRQESLKDVLVSLGGYEIYTYPFINKREADLFNVSPALELEIPPIEDKNLLRPTLLPGMLTVITANPETPFIIFFEMAKTYKSDQETLTLCIATASNNQSEGDNWWQNLFERLRLPVSSWMARTVPASDDIRSAYKIRKSHVTLLELPVEEIISARQGEIPQVTIPDLDSVSYTPLVKYQISRRDIAFIVDKVHSPAQLTGTMLKFHPYIVAVELFDTYTNSKIGDDKYSVAFHIHYQSPDKTLTATEIQEIHFELETFLKEQFHATIR